MRPQLVFAHGWALDHTLWDAVLPLLGDAAADAVILDRGYYGPVANPAPQPGRTLLGVGQSLGVLELLADPPAPLAGLVCIDGFACYVASADFHMGVSPRIIALMRQRLVADFGAVVSEFLRRAVGNPPAGPAQIDRLDQGLARLEALDGRAAARDLPIWRLHAAGDLIAPLALSDASFAGARRVERHVRLAGDHLSPLTAPKACADLILKALKTLS